LLTTIRERFNGRTSRRFRHSRNFVVKCIGCFCVFELIQIRRIHQVSIAVGFFQPFPVGLCKPSLHLRLT
jgi:hypothetical protein